VLVSILVEGADPRFAFGAITFFCVAYVCLYIGLPPGLHSAVRVVLLEAVLDECRMHDAFV
jgi:hypothetical protein